MNVFEVVMIGVAVLGAAGAGIVYLRGPGALDQLGQQGSRGSRPSDRSVSDRASEDDATRRSRAAPSAAGLTDPGLAA